MTKQIDTTAENNGLRLVTQGSHSSAPSSGHVLLYHVTGTVAPGAYLKDSTGRQMRIGVSPPQINATDISGCVLWHDADQETGADGDAVGTVQDFSSSNNDATQGTGANKPTLRLNVANGRKGLYFDGGDYLTYGTNIDIPTAHTILFTIIPMPKAAYSAILQYKQQGLYQSINGTLAWGVYRSGDGQADWIEGGQPQVVGLWGSSNSVYDFIHNYARKAGTNTNSFTAAATSYLGTDILAVGTQNFAGYILEGAVYDNKISEANLYSYIDWQLYKWANRFA